MTPPGHTGKCETVRSLIWMLRAQEGTPAVAGTTQGSFGRKGTRRGQASHPQAGTSGAEAGGLPRTSAAGRLVGPGSANTGIKHPGLASASRCSRSGRRGVRPTYSDRVSHLALPFPGSTLVLTLLPAPCTLSPQPCPPEAGQGPPSPGGPSPPRIRKATLTPRPGPRVWASPLGGRG